MYTSASLTLSPMLMDDSLFENFEMSHLAICIPRRLQIDCASAGWEEPAKIEILRIHDKKHSGFKK